MISYLLFVDNEKRACFVENAVVFPRVGEEIEIQTDEINKKLLVVTKVRHTIVKITSDLRSFETAVYHIWARNAKNDKLAFSVSDTDLMLITCPIDKKTLLETVLTCMSLPFHVCQEGDVLL